MAFLFLALASVLSQATDAAAKPRPIFTIDDYPADALRNRWQGVVVADLTISPEGKATACRIVKSSGYKVLDDRTCKILIERPTFVPDKDENGRPRESTLRTPPITWALP
jgi:protein TonB